MFVVSPANLWAWTGDRQQLTRHWDTARRILDWPPEEGVPISVTLVKPASVDTPFFEKAKTYLGMEPQPVPPVYAPQVVRSYTGRQPLHKDRASPVMPLPGE